MNYKACYERLIARARARTLSGYSEKHHVIPKCLGGDNSRDNIVRLTPEEHYVAHQLLVKMHPHNHRLAWSAVAMTNKTQRMGRQNKLYGWLRRRFAEEMAMRNRGQKRSEETLRKMREARLGKKFAPHTAETKHKMSLASKGRKKSAEHRASMSRQRIGRKVGAHSEEWRKNQSIAIKKAFEGIDRSKWLTPEYRAKQSQLMIEVWAKRKAATF